MDFSDDDRQEIRSALAVGVPEPPRTLSRGEQVSRAAHLEQELRRSLAASPPRISAARELFVANIADVALPAELIGLGHELEWPGHTAQVVARRLLDEVAENPRLWWSQWGLLVLLPLQRLDLPTLRSLLDSLPQFGPSFDPEAELDVPELVRRLHEALLDAGAPSDELEMQLAEVRRWMAQERAAYWDEYELEHSLARRLREVEREAQCRLPPDLRYAWLYRSAELAARGIVFGDPGSEDCFATSLHGGPAAVVAVDSSRRALVFASPTVKPSGLSLSGPDRYDLADCYFALDLGRPLQRGGYVDYPVMLVFGECSFLADVAATSVEWLR